MNPSIAPVPGPFQQEVLVDNTDPRIKYNGSGWSLLNTAQVTNIDRSQENGHGRALFSTLHTVSTEANGRESLSFSYHGSNGRIAGVNPWPNGVNLGDSPDGPRWACTIDGNAAKVLPRLGSYQNNWSLCEWEAAEGDHEVTFTIVNLGARPTDANFPLSQWNPFFFDYIAYVPPMINKLPHIEPGQTLWVGSNDSSIGYQGAWALVPGVGRRASDGGDTISFSFMGTGVQMLAAVLANAGDYPNGTYTLDKGRPTPFNIDKTGITLTTTTQITTTNTIPGTLPPPGSTVTMGATPSFTSSSSADLFNQRYIDIPSIPSQVHTIAVTYARGDSIAPFIFSGFVVHHQISGPSSTSDPNPDPPIRTRRPLIIGLSVGLFFFFLSTALLLWIWYRRQRQQAEEAKESDVQPFVPSRGSDSTPPPMTQRSRSKLGPGASSDSEASTTTRPPEAGPSTLNMPSDPAIAGNLVETLIPLPPSPSGQVFHHQDSGLRIVEVEGVVTVATAPSYVSAAGGGGWSPRPS